MDETLSQLNKIFCKVFRKNDLVINNSSNAVDIEGWDSLTHIELITEIEKHFALKFTFTEVMAFQSVGDISACIDNHLKV